MAPVISIIIPTHNRSSSLQRTLDALCQQTVPPHLLEVVVVADGCTDDTVAMLGRYSAPFTLRVLEQASQGAAVARNHGAAQTQGNILLFLDDDIEPMPTLVAAHVTAHQVHPGRVVIGAYPPVAQRATGLFQSHIQHWWEQKFSALSETGHRFTYCDLLSGNLSLAAALFQQIGRFDEGIADCGGEDYELGVRLIEANIDFTFVADALGNHHIHETTDLRRSFQRARQEGGVDTRIGQRYPMLRKHLACGGIHTYGLLRRVILRLLLFPLAFVSELLAASLPIVLDGLEEYGFSDYWRTLYQLTYRYWYWRGVADKIGSWHALVQFGRHSVKSNEASLSELDLSQGLSSAVEQIDRERPLALRIRYGRQPIGWVPPQPGAERLRGVHLRTILCDNLSVPCLEALAIEGAIPGSSRLDRYRLFHAIRSKSHWFGPTHITRVWYEQYSQWRHLDQPQAQFTREPDLDWEGQRQEEYTWAWSIQEQPAPHWRLQLYRTLYHWHEPLYHWYTSRGWMWPTKVRQRLKQVLVNQTQR